MKSVAKYTFFLSFRLEVSAVDEAVVTVALVEVAVDVGIALGLPGAYLDTGQIRVVEVYHQEEIARVGIRRGVIVLVDLDAIGVGSHPHLLHIVIREADVDELIALEAALHVADVFLLAETRVLHHLVVEILLVLCIALGLADDVTHDDDGIVVEDALDIVGTLQGEGSLVVLEEGGYHHADAVVPAPGLTVEDVIARCLVETEGNRLYQATLVEGEGARYGR